MRIFLPAMFGVVAGLILLAPFEFANASDRPAANVPSVLELNLTSQLNKLKNEQGQTQTKIEGQIKKEESKIITVKQQRVREKKKRDKKFEALKKKWKTSVTKKQRSDKTGKQKKKKIL